MKKFLTGILLLVLCSAKSGQQHLKPYFHHDINIPEPSDICLSTIDPSHYYIVSNRGCIAETDSNGKILRHTPFDGSDYEGVCIKDNMIYAMDESMRRIDMINQSDFSLHRSYYLNYSGARNKGFEGLVYMPDRKLFVAVVEKPAIVMELNEQLQVVSQTQMRQFFELSSVTYHDKFLWFLSDENHEVMKVNPDNFAILKRWNLPVNNPEGICFDTNNNLLIVSDDMSELFKFKISNP